MVMHDRNKWGHAEAPRGCPSSSDNTLKLGSLNFRKKDENSSFVGHPSSHSVPSVTWRVSSLFGGWGNGDSDAKSLGLGHTRAVRRCASSRAHWTWWTPETGCWHVWIIFPSTHLYPSRLCEDSAPFRRLIRFLGFFPLFFPSER